MKTDKTDKLRLRTETLRILDSVDLAAANGGTWGGLIKFSKRFCFDVATASQYIYTAGKAIVETAQKPSPAHPNVMPNGLGPHSKGY